MKHWHWNEHSERWEPSSSVTCNATYCRMTKRNRPRKRPVTMRRTW